MSRAEGAAFAKKHGCLFVETSAKANVAVGQAFEELVMKVHWALKCIACINVGGPGCMRSCFVIRRWGSGFRCEARASADHPADGGCLSCRCWTRPAC